MDSGTQSQEHQDQLREYRLRAKRSPWLAYPLTCVPAIRPWHESLADYRVLSGPNDGGKTTAGAADLVSYSMGYNPIRKETYETPNMCWAVCVELKSAGRVMFRKLSEMMPRKTSGRRDWKYYKQEHLIVLGNGSEIAIKSQKEGESSLLGERCTAIWVDEATGGDTGLENFGELQARGLPDRPLKMFFTLTPKMDTGIEWMHRRLWREPGKEPHEEFIDGTFCHQFQLSDCLIEKGGFISPEVYRQKVKNTDPNEVAARLHGLWQPFMSRPAFSFGLMLKALERAPKQRPIRWVSTFTKPKWEDCDSGPGKMLQDRESGAEYIAAWDPSEGLGKGHDPSSVVVFKRNDLSEVYHARANDLHPEKFYREVAMPAAQYYNDSLLIIESNGKGGGAALSAAINSPYQNLYVRQLWDKVGAVSTNRLGWLTTASADGGGGTRGRMLDALQRALREEKWTPSRDLLEEMQNMTVKRMDSGRIRIEHADGYHDDLVMAAGIALAVHYEEPLSEMPDLETLRLRYTGKSGMALSLQGGIGSPRSFYGTSTLSET